MERSDWLSQLEREMRWLVLLAAMPPTPYDLEVLCGVEGVLDRLDRHLESPPQAPREADRTNPAAESDFDRDLRSLRLAALAVGTEPLARILLRLADLEALQRSLCRGAADASTVRRCEVEAELSCLRSGIREWSGSPEGPRSWRRPAG